MSLGWSMVVAASLVLPVSGCYARYRSESVQASGGTVVSTGINVSTGSAVGSAIIVGVMLADGVHYYRLGPDGKTPMYGAPELDPRRKINVQDCTRPFDRSAGNLMCR